MKEVFEEYNITHGHSDISLEIFHMPKFFEQRPQGPYTPHVHSFYQIIWFKRANGYHEVDFKRYPIKDNTLVFVSPGQIHRFEDNRQCEGTIIHFNEDFLTSEGSSESVFIKYNVFNALDAVPYYYIEEDTAKHLQTIVDNLDEEMNNQSEFAHKDVLKMLIRLFLVNIQRKARRGEGEALCVNNTANRTFVRFRQSLEHHFKEMHMVKEYAALLNVTSRVLTSSVWESAHTTPLQIINERIALEAKRLLTYSDMKIKEVGYSLGFEDPSYFVKFFKRMVGVSPVVFRENVEYYKNVG